MKRVRAWLAVWAGWTALALFFAVSTSLTYRSTGRPANWTLTIERSLTEWWLWAALTPLVFFLARRFPLHGSRRARHIAVHVAAGVVIAALKTIAERLIFFLLTFGAVTSDQIQIGSRGNVHLNAPFAILQLTSIMTLFIGFIVVAMVAGVVIRDDETGFAPILRSTRIGK